MKGADTHDRSECDCANCKGFRAGWNAAMEEAISIWKSRREVIEVDFDAHADELSELMDAKE